MAASNFSSLRSSRKNLINKLTEAIKQETSKAGQDERFWKLAIDQKTGIGFAKLRFLPQPKNEELPWVRLYQHAFKGPKGSWLIENCPTSLGQRECPICKKNTELWNSGVDADKKIASERKRKQQYISNVLVLEDPTHPENVGKVMLFKYGKKIYEKITDIIEPQFPDRKPADPFDLDEGCDFKLKSQKKDNFINYDKSEFSDPSKLFDGDEKKQEATWEAEHSLAAFVDEKQFKSYEELDKRLNAVLTGAGRSDAPKTAEEAIKSGNAENDDAIAEVAAQAQAASLLQQQPAKPATRPRRTVKTPTPVVVSNDSVPDDEEELRAFFADIVGGDK